MVVATKKANHVPNRKAALYGSVDSGLNLFWITTELLVFFYYTDVLGLPNAAAGAIFAAASVWDAITDPLVGIYAGRKTGRFGRYRPYLMFGAPLVALSFAAMFLLPDLSAGLLIAASLVTHLVFRTFYTLVAVPYWAMSATITQDARERTKLAGFRMVSAGVAGLLVASGTLPLAEFLGGEGGLRRGFAFVALIYGVLAVIIIATAGSRLIERAEVDPVEPPSLQELKTMLRSNSALWLLAGAIMLVTIGSTLKSKMLVYVFQYEFGRPDLLGLALALPVAALILLTPLWAFVSRKIGKQAVWIIGSALFVLGSIALYLVPTGNVGLLIAGVVLGATGSSAFPITYWGMVPDTVEFGELKSGIRAEFAVAGTISFMRKLALGLGFFAVGLTLDLISYSANEVQSPATLDGLRLLMSLVPGAFVFLSAAIIMYYPLSLSRHAEITEQLHARREK